MEEETSNRSQPISGIQNNNIAEDNSILSAIRDSLVNIAVDISDIKKRLKDQPVISSLPTIDSVQSFEAFNNEIERDTNRFDNFMSVLKNIANNNHGEVQSNLPKYFKLVLRACLNKKCLPDLTWKPYKKHAIYTSRIVQAILLSATEVDQMSTEFDKQNILHKEFKRYKDASRTRRSKLLLDIIYFLLRY